MTHWIVGTGFSRGIGLEVAKKMREREFKILHIGRTQSNMEDEFLFCDLSRPMSAEFLSALCETLKNKSIYGFFYGAGVFPSFIQDRTTPHDNAQFWHEQEIAMHVNYLTCTQLVDIILPFIANSAEYFLKHSSDLDHLYAPHFIAHLSSLSAVDPLPGFELYGITKLACLKYFENLSKTLDFKKVACLAIHPGTVQTDMLNNVLKEAELQNLPVFDILKSEQDAHRIITASESAEAIVQLIFDSHSADMRKKMHGQLSIV